VILVLPEAGKNDMATARDRYAGTFKSPLS
jgi:hypothetical protein